MRKNFKSLYFEKLVNSKDAKDIVLNITGELASYDISVSYIEKCDTINISTIIALDFATSDTTILKDMILAINNGVLVGKFELFTSEDITPKVAFSLSQPLVREMNIEITFISRLLELAVNTIETFFQCLEAIRDGDLQNVDDLELFIYDQNYTA